MHNADNGSKRFITEEGLSEVWADVCFRDLFPESEWHDEEITSIRKCYRKILSILILIGWPNIGTSDLDWFRESFLSSANNQRNDTSLPLSEDDLDLEGPQAADFLQWQYAFCPVVIEERPGSFIQRIEKERRLPFIGDQTPLGYGGFGEVAKVTVAPRCYRDVAKNQDNNQVRT